MSRIVLGLVLSCGLHAQDRPTFDPSRDLEGFEQAAASEFSDLYPLKTYLELRGKELTPAELEALRKRWQAEREAALKRIGDIRADPREARFYELESRLERHRYFSKIHLEVDRSIPDCFFLVQKQQAHAPATRDPRKFADFFGPPVKQMRNAFVKGIAEPLGFQRRADYPLFAVCILADEDEYHAFGQETEQLWKLNAAYYDPQLRLIVAYGDPEGTDRTPALQRRLVFSEFGRALQQAYYGGTDDRPHSLWLHLGFASWYGWREGVLAEVSDKTQVDPDLLARVIKLTQSEKDREILLYPVVDLLQLRTTTDVLQLAKNRAEELKADPPNPDVLLHAFYDQSALWMHFLHDGLGGRYREPFLKFFQSSMNGLGGLDAFYIAFRGIDIASLDREFYTASLAEHAREFPRIPTDSSWIEKPFAERASPSGSSAPAAEPVSAIPASSAPYSANSVAAGPQDLDAQHALALVKAKQGDLEGALGSLEALAAQSPPPPEGDRIARDIERVKQFMLLREGYFANLVATGESISGKYRGVEYVAKVARVEDGWLHLATNPLGLSKIPLSAIEPFDIAKQAGSKAEQGAAKPWVRFWPYVLVGETKWQQLLKDESAGALALREDARSWYPEMLKTANAAVVLNEIAAMPEPKTKKDAEKLFAAVKALVAAYGDVPLVQRKIEPMRQLVGSVIVRTYAEEDPAKACHGVWTTLGNGLVDIVYDFTKADEAEDFRRIPDYLVPLHESQTPTVKKEDASSWAVTGGEFVGTGAAAYRHFAELEVPIVVRYDVLFREGPSKSPSAPAFTFMVAACDDLNGSYAGCINFGSLSVVDVESKSFKTLAEDAPAFAKKVYHLELHNDGNTVTTFVNGKKKFESPAAGRRRGAVLLWFHVDHTLAVQRLEIQGKIDPRWPEKAKMDYYRARLDEMGLR
ncbi:MAG: hypothetical protein ACKVXR_05185 [Planctomycetota bacterium]